MTVTPKDEGLDPTERPAQLYARFLDRETLEGPGGLILRHFEASSPYDLEELYIAPPDGRSFFARCPKPARRDAGKSCLSMFRDGGIDVELRYRAGAARPLGRVFDGAHALLARMTAAAQRKRARSLLFEIEIENGDLQREARQLGVVRRNDAEKFAVALSSTESILRPRATMVSLSFSKSLRR